MIVPNLPILTIFSIMNSAISKIPFNEMIKPVSSNIASMIFSANGEQLFQRITVKKLLEGKELTILNALNSILRPLKLLGISLSLGDFRMRENKFGIIHMRNNTKKDKFEIYARGKKFGQLVRFNGKR